MSYPIAGRGRLPLAAAILMALGGLTNSACSNGSDGASASDEAAVSGSGRCTVAPISSKVSSLPGLGGLVPPFSATTWATERAATAVGSWQRENSSAFASLYDPNRWAGSGHLAIDAPSPGAYVHWSLGIQEGDAGRRFSVYTFVPSVASATKAYYRIYDGLRGGAAKAIEINQDRPAPAQITLNGKTYAGPGWVSLGTLQLYPGASVSLDASASRGRLAADTVVAVKWGCAEVP